MAAELHIRSDVGELLGFCIVGCCRLDRLCCNPEREILESVSFEGW
jgi:hypothetical protein